MELENILIDLSDIRVAGKPQQVLLQFGQLFVRTLLIRQYRYAILRLVNVGVGTIVHQHNVLWPSVYYADVLYVHAVKYLEATVAVQFMSEDLVLGVDFLQHLFGIALYAAGVCHDLVQLGHILQKCERIGSQLNVCGELGPILVVNLQLEIIPHILIPFIITIEYRVIDVE